MFDLQRTIDSLLNFSYLDYHQPDFTYLCLSQKDGHFQKVYFFDGNTAHAPEVVAPHNHRYRFSTQLLHGHYINYTFFETENPAGLPHYKWAYHTPLLGGKGFTLVGPAFLVPGLQILRTPNENYSYLKPCQLIARSHHWHTHKEIHTIRVSPGTILFLAQERDLVKYRSKTNPLPTYTYTRTPIAPSLDNLYRRPTPQQIIPFLQRLLPIDHKSCYTALSSKNLKSTIEELQKL